MNLMQFATSPQQARRRLFKDALRQNRIGGLYLNFSFKSQEIA